jgi:enoyl-CoA hydratase/carnithine racemase
MEIILSGDRVTAEHALRIGLVNRVVPSDTLLAETMAYARRLASRAPLAQRFALDVMRRAQGMSLVEALKLESRSFHDLGETEDLKEGTAAFREKREARFKAR